MNDKTRLRSELRRRRKALSPADRARAERAVLSRLRPLLQRGRRIGVYLAMGSELDLRGVLALMQQRGTQALAPMVPRRGRRLRFAALPIRHGCRDTVSARALDAVLVPLVGFDAHCGRLGQGGGYYDTSFAFRRYTSRPRLIGVAFECQRLAVVPMAPHDRRLDAVLTELGWYGRKPVRL
ncbi:5-formyltetrahydrofolate cyclo-ligase [Chitinimonas sp. BJYL2]|uniref:5-formyltetrahydrofolate cyclo-ligase n=1 Tax=Chitinimonas sp. BJYL2 TaxID=2976696 RepID=UPI0022B327C0|nr:5-formyltetrahydrofolate cyclo-ligase [Chitinimonas sp. BJYL2]